MNYKPSHEEQGFKLFPHQEAVIPEVLRSLRPDNPTLLVAPTGSGKTVIAAEIALHYRTVLFVAHRKEIVDQARAEMGKNVQCMSIHQALHHGPPKVDFLIIDEAHRSTAKTYQEVIKKYPGACVMGMTATAWRTDGQGLIDVFDEIVEGAGVKALVSSGHLVPYFAFEAPDEALSQLAHMKRQRGDYATRELSALMNRPRLVGDVVREYKKHGMGRKAVAFAVSIEHSKALARAFSAAGIRSAHLDGRASKTVRETALANLAKGKLDVLCNVNLFTEGWDCPAVSCVIMARPTASLTLYLQSVGRGMRTSPGKTDLLILDHAGNIERHGEPDEERTWSLESDAQKAKREKEVSELERLHTLGYESVEAELEARRRIQEETYSARECQKKFAPYCKSIASCTAHFLRLRGISPRIKATNSRSCYPKAEIDELVRVLTGTILSRDARKLLGLPESTFGRFIKHNNIKAITGNGNQTRYSLADISRLNEETFSFAECIEVLGNNSRAKLLRLFVNHNIKTVSGRKRYSKKDIYGLKAVLDSAASAMGEFIKTLTDEEQLFFRMYKVERVPRRLIYERLGWPSSKAAAFVARLDRWLRLGKPTQGKNAS